MDRRDFLKISAAGAAGLIVTGKLNAADLYKAEQLEDDGYYDDLVKMDGAQLSSTRVPLDGGQVACPVSDRLKIRFKGTNAAGRPAWGNGEYHRHSCILIEDSVMIDLTSNSLDIVPADGSVKALCFTHSHPDHYDPVAVLKVGVPTVYIHESWAGKALAQFRKTAAELSASEGREFKVPEVVPTHFGQRIVFNKGTEHELTITPLMADHVTSIEDEFSVIYLIEKMVPERWIEGSRGTDPFLGGENQKRYDPRRVRILYATDTSGITGKAARRSGIDCHRKDGWAINGLIMESTMGPDFVEDYRLYNHSSTGTVATTANVLMKTGRLIPGGNQPVYITHMSRSLFGSKKVAEIDSLLAAYGCWENTDRQIIRAASDDLVVLYE